ncbi:MAG: DUF7024 domain-containing protein, partial [Candidatus Promineifilaceae bacterium]
YYFTLPLFYIVAAGSFSTTFEINKIFRYLVGAVVAICGIYSVWINLVPFTPNLVGSPEIRGLHVNNLYFRVIGGLLISALALWLFFQRRGLQLYLYLALPLFVVVSTSHVGVELNNRLKQDVYDKAGIFTKQYLTNEDLSKVVIVGSEPSGLFRSLYYLDNAKASLDFIQSGADYDLPKLPAGKEWILVVGDHGITGAPFYQIPMNGFSLIRASGENVLDFKKGAWPGIIRKVKGLSTPESWGTWSQSDVVMFEFTGPLPSRFEIHLVAHAFGPNVDKEFVASVGESAIKFSLSANVEQQIIRLDNPKGTNVLRLKIPNAVSPKALGLSGDERNLGIAFVEMKIVTPPVCLKQQAFTENSPSQVGVIENGQLVSDGKQGFLFFGFYRPLNASRYRLVVRGEGTVTDTAWVDVVSQKGTVQHARFPLSSTSDGNKGVLAEGVVTLESPVKDVEVRVFVGEQDVVRLDGYELVPVNLEKTRDINE